jgi:hypothetical protein
MTRPRTLLVVLVAGALMAGCTTEISSSPAPTLTSTTSTSTTTTTTTTTTSIPATTTTVAPPEATAPTGPTTALVPLLVGGDDGGWLYLGGWQFDQWTKPVDASGNAVSAPIGEGAPVEIRNLTTSTSATLGAPATACFDGRTGPTADVTVPPLDPPGSGYAAVALPTPNWDPTPRPIAVTSTGPAAYAALGAAGLTGTAVDATKGTIGQLVIADLDGDGDDEALMVYEKVTADSIRGASGDFSSLSLVEVPTRTATTIEKSFVPLAASPTQTAVLDRFSVLDVADYNGDGKMEVAVSSWYYEGASVTVYTYDGVALTPVLTTGCGA